tara:strand:- start:232 stop:1863 length:1632 start_codon:yes stop_codon:yes gene_type:complete
VSSAWEWETMNLVSLIYNLLIAWIISIIIGALATQKEWTKQTSRKPSYLPWYKRIARSVTSFCVFQFMFIRLVLFAMLLLPAFLRIGWWYARSKNIIRSITYGKGKLRQNLDVYVPKGAKEKSAGLPVLFFTGGGAWVVGHKAFCALIGRIFMNEGVIVVTPDYRQFPQVGIDEMLSDVDEAIQWTFDHIQEYGGDVTKIFIAGQSAGAHLTSSLVLEHASKEIKERKGTQKVKPNGLGLGITNNIIEGEEEEEDGTNEKNEKNCPSPKSPSINTTTQAAHIITQQEDAINNQQMSSNRSNKPEGVGGSRALKLLPWKCSQIAGYVGISGPYQLVHLREHLFHRGIEQVSFLTHLIGGEKTSLMTDTQRDVALAKQSPAIRLRSSTFQGDHETGGSGNFGSWLTKGSVFPPFVLIHGESDNVVPTRSTKEFAKSLRSAGIDVTVKYLRGASHTDPIIEDLLFDESGGKEAGAITELLHLIRSTDRTKGNGNDGDGKSIKKMRRPSMLAAGFGYVTNERGKLPDQMCGCIPRTVIRLARYVNPF